MDIDRREIQDLSHLTLNNAYFVAKKGSWVGFSIKFFYWSL
jgi:hypothetical protein